MSSRDLLLSDIEAFLKRFGMGAAAFGVAALNDGRFVSRLRAGKDVRLETADRVRAFMKSYAASGKPRPRFRASGAAA
jgi:hypothetical protein